MPSHISLRHLRCFLAIAESGSFTAASKTLFLTQSALTATIQQLEDAVGLRLFERTTRRVELTREAMDFLPHARRVVADFDGTIQDLRAVADGRRGEIRIAAAASLIDILLADAIREFRSHFPEVRFILRDSSAAHLEELVQQSEVDLALTGRFHGVDALQYLPVIEDTYGVLHSPGFTLPAEGEAPLPWASLTPNGFVSFTSDTGVRAFLAGRLDWIEPTVAQADEVSSTTALFSLLSATPGYSIVPALAGAQGAPLGLRFRLLTAPALTRPLYLVSRKSRAMSTASLRFLETVVRLARSRSLPEGARLTLDPIQTFALPADTPSWRPEP